MGLLLSESFSVERDLPIKARFIPDRARPALVLSMHHIAGDGRSVLGWIRSLHRVLNGEELAPVPVDPPGHLPALVPESLGDMPRALMEELRAFAGASRPGPYRRAPHQHLDSYGPIAVFPHRLSSPGSALVAAARARGTTVGTLIFSAAALAFHRLAPGPSGDVIRARLSIDLRDLYPAGRTPGDGNYVSSFVVDVDPRIGIDAMLPAIDASTRANIERYKRRSMMMTSLSREASTWLGRHQTGRVALYAKRLDRHTTQSFHLSNLGRIDGLESGGIPVECVLPSLAHPDLMIPFIGFGGNLTINVSYPRAEVSRDFIRALVIEIDEVLAPLGHTAASDARARLRASN
ncbi:MAG: hypothetical protein H5U40_14685, partial [Polyangiaceae bacterium]|nr:hypothetical protein [Polyangiaceae bacterium]